MDTIETERLILRPFSVDDVEALHALGTHPEIVRWVGNKPYGSLDDARNALQRGPLRDYEVHGYGRFACVWRATSQVIGFSGIKFVPEVQDAELGYRFLPQFWGRGIATESGQASIEFARDRLNLRRLVALVHPHNAASARVVRKLGFAIERRVKLPLFDDGDVDLFARAL